MKIVFIRRFSSVTAEMIKAWENIHRDLRYFTWNERRELIHSTASALSFKRYLNDSSWVNVNENVASLTSGEMAFLQRLKDDFWKHLMRNERKKSYTTRRMWMWVEKWSEKKASHADMPLREMLWKAKSKLKFSISLSLTLKWARRPCVEILKKTIFPGLLYKCFMSSISILKLSGRVKLSNYLEISNVCGRTSELFTTKQQQFEGMLIWSFKHCSMSIISIKLTAVKLNFSIPFPAQITLHISIRSIEISPRRRS